VIARGNGKGEKRAATGHLGLRTYCNTKKTKKIK